MKKNDDDKNMISTTTKVILLYWTWKWHFPVLKLHPKTKGVIHVADMRLQPIHTNNTYEDQNETLPLFLWERNFTHIA